MDWLTIMGENNEHLFNLDNSLLTVANNAMIFEREGFFVGRDYDQGTNYIYHSTLRQGGLQKYIIIFRVLNALVAKEEVVSLLVL